MHSTREGWLQEAVDEMRPYIKRMTGKDLPEIRISMGFPSARAFSAKKTRLGECWYTEAVSDGVHEIMVSPIIGDDIVHVLGVLMHELVHVLAGPKYGHRGLFKSYAILLGLEGPMPQALPGAELRLILEATAEHVGPFPGGAITAPARKKQTTRMIKIGCECGVIARASRKAIGQMRWCCPDCGTQISEKG